MVVPADNQEIHRTILSFDEMLNQQFYENQNSRTKSSIDYFSNEMIYLNFKKSNNYIQVSAEYIDQDLSNQTETKIIKLPFYFNENKNKLNKLYQNIISKKGFFKDKIEIIEKNYIILRDNISELNFNDIHLEITKSNLIRFSTVFGDNKILIISKDVSDNDTDIIYSYFINRKLIASDVSDISIFTQKFNEYLCL